MFRIVLASIAFFIICLLTGFQAATPVAKSPNIVLFFIDDLGYGDLSVTGALGYKTPNLDKLAAEGTRFTNFMAAQAVCSASRAALLTGCYPNRLGVSGAFGPASKVGLNPKEETIAELVKAKGYATGIFGKWHLGSEQEFLPLQQGFDEYFGIPYSHDMWPLHPWQERAKYPPLHWIEGNKPGKEIKTLDDASELTPRITERAVSFIRKNKNKPFFLYVPHPLPHVPLAASPQFRGKSERGIFGDVLMELDWSVGEIMKELKNQGIDGNTLVIFTSDNGPWLNYGDHAGSSGGFREGKGTSFEGGQREPCIIRWPGVVPAGRVSNKLLSTLDVLPTIARITGASLPKEKIDGIDFTDLLKGDDTRTPREQFLYYYRKNSLEAVRKHNWKLVFEHPGRTYEGSLPGKNGQPGPSPEDHVFPKALYDLTRDPGERYNVLDQHPDVVTDLERIAEAAREDLGDDLQQRTGKNARPAGQVMR
ncbi:sulfatase family protein [Dyadobacter aurulentus]|uniref:sulfatase family protein n=1 Tax=Dyadobacter sp. UC 10 TaxID=2605428 RepID=UPI0011F22740|nr:sulfatase [Dyadobacter sp. UC 10]KAA0991196.1 sulfatase [Dyadobacter sp. UC 10]